MSRKVKKPRANLKPPLYIARASNFSACQTGVNMKKQYATPHIEDLGNVASLTQGTVGKGTDQGLGKNDGKGS